MRRGRGGRGVLPRRLVAEPSPVGEWIPPGSWPATAGRPATAAAGKRATDRGPGTSPRSSPSATSDAGPGRGRESIRARASADQADTGVLFMAGMRQNEVSPVRWSDVADTTDGGGIRVAVRRQEGDTWDDRGRWPRTAARTVPHGPPGPRSPRRRSAGRQRGPRSPVPRPRPGSLARGCAVGGGERIHPECSGPSVGPDVPASDRRQPAGSQPGIASVRLPPGLGSLVDETESGSTPWPPRDGRIERTTGERRCQNSR